MDAKIAVFEVVAGAGLAYLITWALEWRFRRRSQPKAPIQSPGASS